MTHLLAALNELARPLAAGLQMPRTTLHLTSRQLARLRQKQKQEEQTAEWVDCLANPTLLEVAIPPASMY